MAIKGTVGKELNNQKLSLKALSKQAELSYRQVKMNCLLNMTGDATGKTLSRLGVGETTEGMFRLLWTRIERHGIQLALEKRKHSITVLSLKFG